MYPSIKRTLRIGAYCLLAEDQMNQNAKHTAKTFSIIIKSFYILFCHLNVFPWCVFHPPTPNPKHLFFEQYIIPWKRELTQRYWFSIQKTHIPIITSLVCMKFLSLAVSKQRQSLTKELPLESQWIYHAGGNTLWGSSRNCGWCNTLRVVLPIPIPVLSPSSLKPFLLHVFSFKA